MTELFELPDRLVLFFFPCKMVLALSSEEKNMGHERGKGAEVRRNLARTSPRLDLEGSTKDGAQAQFSILHRVDSSATLGLK